MICIQITIVFEYRTSSHSITEFCFCKPDSVDSHFGRRSVIDVTDFTNVDANDFGDEAAVPVVVAVKAGTERRYQHAVKGHPVLGVVRRLEVEVADKNKIKN